MSSRWRIFLRRSPKSLQLFTSVLYVKRDLYVNKKTSADVLHSPAILSTFDSPARFNWSPSMYSLARPKHRETGRERGKGQEESKGKRRGTDNLATKGFTARNRHSVWKFEFYLVVSTLPARLTGCNFITAPRYTAGWTFFFFVHRKIRERRRRFSYTPMKTTTRCWFHSWRNLISKGLWRGWECMDYMYRLLLTNILARMAELAISINVGEM